MKVLTLWWQLTSSLVKLIIVVFVIGLVVGLVIGVRAGLAWDGDLVAFDAVVGGR